MGQSRCYRVCEKHCCHLIKRGLRSIIKKIMLNQMLTLDYQECLNKLTGLYSWSGQSVVQVVVWKTPETIENWLRFNYSMHKFSLECLILQSVHAKCEYQSEYGKYVICWTFLRIFSLLLLTFCVLFHIRDVQLSVRFSIFRCTLLQMFIAISSCRKICLETSLHFLYTLTTAILVAFITDFYRQGLTLVGGPAALIHFSNDRFASWSKGIHDCLKKR